MQVFQGSLKDLNGRNDNEIAIYKLLDELGIEFSRADHKPVCSMEECQIVNELLKPAKHCKNLFLCPVNKSQYYMLVMEENKKFASGKISRQVNSSRLQFGNDEDLYKYLGVRPGSVGVLALLHDKENKVQLLVDEDLLATEYITCHPGVNTSSVALKTSDLFLKYLQKVHHNYIVVKCL